MQKFTLGADFSSIIPCYEYTTSALDASMNRFLSLLGGVQVKSDCSTLNSHSEQLANDMTVCIDLDIDFDDDSEDSGIFTTDCAGYDNPIYTLVKDDTSTLEKLQKSDTSTYTRQEKLLSSQGTPKSILRRGKAASRTRSVVSFDDTTYEGETHSRAVYNRKAIGITASSAQFVYKELMMYKLLSMVVHDSSVHNMNLHTSRCGGQERASKEKIINNILAAAQT
ncbi:hypothetical protein SARC_04352 [Sphaeroforma arctica JP610]|uniref:Uncharacterized protein n=1 Tax=Sphaeroforma arctica JP610 TaxID=667725 RepID=A0A0L0G3G8_9EUKA|nr:hypothetical protein SARC_04352 [Sphaeroforma arctica JP610]KNC83386.1 hypothetical protein SARC_04352 [Sphaeroforma arctica JP610]|eukprot:XP_014157288.1 hypothetical protein SARC_04352 [Sphaeroforma arctica JP610]